jgi:3-oxoadipate enol-lactonase
MTLEEKAITRRRAGAGPVLVLLHCLGVDHHIWDETAAALSSSHTVLRYDFPGHGDTPVPSGAYSIADLSDQLRAVLDADGIRQASIAGISLGGLVAQHFAATHYERTECLILVDTTPRYSDTLRGMWAERAETARKNGVAVMTTPLLDIWFTPDFVKSDPPPVRYVRDCFSRTSGEGYALACEALAVADLRPLVPRIGAPTLIVCGTEDIPEFIAAAHWLENEIDRARLAWLSPARHASILEQPRAFAALCDEFLARQ